MVDSNDFNLKCTLYHTTCVKDSLLQPASEADASAVLVRSLQLWLDHNLFHHALLQGRNTELRPLVRGILTEQETTSGVIEALETAGALVPGALATFTKLCGAYVQGDAREPHAKRARR